MVNSELCRYLHFDFHKICGHVHFERLSILYEQIEDFLIKNRWVSIIFLLLVLKTSNCQIGNGVEHCMKDRKNKKYDSHPT